MLHQIILQTLFNCKEWSKPPVLLSEHAHQFTAAATENEHKNHLLQCNETNACRCSWNGKVSLPLPDLHKGHCSTEVHTSFHRVTVYPVLCSLHVSVLLLTDQTMCGLPRLRVATCLRYTQAQGLVDAPALLQHLAMPGPAFVGLQLSHKLSPMLGNCLYLPSLTEMSGPQVRGKICHYSDWGESNLGTGVLVERRPLSLFSTEYRKYRSCLSKIFDYNHILTLIAGSVSCLASGMVISQ